MGILAKNLLLNMEPIFSAIPTKSYTSILILLFLTLACSLVAILIQWNKFKNIKGAYKQVGFLLSAFAGLLFFATTVLSIWDSNRIQPLQLYQKHLSCYQGNIPYLEIARAGIYTDKQQSFLNPQVTKGNGRMLVIERKGKPTAVFAEEYYDIDLLVKKINDQMERR